MAITIGARLNHYEVLALLGSGGMGEVYLAQDLKLGRKVALKLLPAQFTSEPERIRRFEQEARAASALNHPNIVTIHEIGAVDGLHFIAAEYIDGVSLREQLAQGKPTLTDALDIAIQAASALAAAHAAGIIHRDIKPDNLMLRRDGYVKVLDFGLANLTEVRNVEGGMRNEEAETLMPSPQNNPQSAIRNPQLTDPGAVLGTPQYMSPEQARGQKVDARTDIFSLGVVLYEMLAGRPPFAGVNAIEVMGAMLKDEPAPLTDAPRELAHIVNKALRKDREQRYQTVRDLLIDLKDFKHAWEFQAELKKNAERGVRNAELGAQTDAPTRTPSHSAFRIPHSVFKSVPLPIRIGVSLVLLAFAAIATFLYVNRPKPKALTDKDTILLAEFENKTGDAVFDGTLRQGLAVQLQQSPFLSFFPDTRVRDTLKLMGRTGDERVTREVGREIAQRQGVKAIIAGTIVSLGRNYSLTLEALNSQTGETLGLTQAEAEGKEEVLKALSQAAKQMREKLGESLGSIQKFDAPLEVTTSSLEALKTWSLGVKQLNNGKNFEAMPFFKRAFELDPNFAAAYSWLATAYSNTSQPALRADYAEKAFALRERASEYEKLGITWAYYTYVTGEVDKEIETLELIKQTYPRDTIGPGLLANVYSRTGQYEKAVAETREALALFQNTAIWRGNLGHQLIRLNRFAEAKETFERALQQKFDSASFNSGLYQIAFINGDVAAMQQQLDSMRGKPDEYAALDWQTGAAAFAGQWKQAQDFSRRAIDLATRSDAKEVAARYAAEQALRAAVLWYGTGSGSDLLSLSERRAQANRVATAPRTVPTLAKESLALARNQVTLTRAALALTLAGTSQQTPALIEELSKRYPKDTLINGIWLPTIRAALGLQRGNAQQAIELLEVAKRYEAAAEFWPQYVRGQAYLKLNQPNEAAAEFQKILGHRGEAPLSVLYPLAQLGVGRAATLRGDAAKARQAYDEFFKLWKDADADLPVLSAAQKEYAKLR